MSHWARVSDRLAFCVRGHAGAYIDPVLDPFHKCVRQNVIRIRASLELVLVSRYRFGPAFGTNYLSVTFAQTHAAIRKPSLMNIRVYQRPDHLSHGSWVENGQKRNLRSKRIPKTSFASVVRASSVDCRFRSNAPVERVKVWLSARPQRVLSGIVLWVDHGPVYATVEISHQRLVDAGN